MNKQIVRGNLEGPGQREGSQQARADSTKVKLLQELEEWEKLGLG